MQQCRIYKRQKMKKLTVLKIGVWIDFPLEADAVSERATCFVSAFKMHPPLTLSPILGSYLVGEGTLSVKIKSKCFIMSHA